MDIASSYPGWGLCISYNANILGKDINPTIRLPAMSK